MKINKKAIITICILAAAAAISGCGKKSAPDAASSQVIQISVAPEETTQTPAPLLNRTVRQIPHRIAARITNGCIQTKSNIEKN